MLKKLVVACFAAAIVSGAATASAQFTDTPSGAFWSAAVDWAAENNLLLNASGTFNPHDQTDRQLAALWMWRMEGSPVAGTHPFTDVPAEVNAAVAWMLSQGVTTGTSDTTFSPESGLTRGQLAAFLWRLAGSPSAPPHSFRDVKAAWQQKAVAWLASTGITTGTSDTTFSPNAPLTRAHLVTFLWRYSNQSATPDQEPPLEQPDPERGNEPPPPQKSVTITVPPEAPSGNCSDRVTLGPYSWERCAWLRYFEDGQHHRALSNEEAADLIQRIWEEVGVEGKPAQPPTSELVPAGSECAKPTADGVIIGCYSPAQHHIRRLDSFNDTLLHELAHALVNGHPTIASCARIINNEDYQDCVHNDIFRCVADYLYVHYAGIDSAGVCGTMPPSGAAPSAGTGTVCDERECWHTYRSSDGELVAYVDAHYVDRDFPYDNTWASLIVRCSRRFEVETFVTVESGYLAANVWTDEISVVYIFIPEEWREWDEDTRSRYTKENVYSEGWEESTANRSAFLSSGNAEDFLNEAVNAYDLHLVVKNFDDSEFGRFSFNMEGAYEPIRAVTEECGWTWS